jgi:hypothetical protein
LISTLESLFVLVVLFGLQYYAYHGILDHAANNASKAMVKDNSTLIGGSNLDLLGLALFIQFGAVLISSKLYYVLILVGPIWGANNLMNTASLFSPPPAGGGPGAFAPPSAAQQPSAYQQHLAAQQKYSLPADYKRQ